MKNWNLIVAIPVMMGFILLDLFWTQYIFSLNLDLLPYTLVSIGTFGLFGVELAVMTFLLYYEVFQLHQTEKEGKKP